MMRHLVLSGFMGSGKSTVGPRVAARLGHAFADLDAVIEAEAGRSIPELFASEGEGGFRRREQETLHKLLESPAPMVLACGGGALLSTSLRHRVLDSATVITLCASAETLEARCSATGRPLLFGSGSATRIKELLEQRRSAYAECHASIPTDDVSVESVVDAIVSAHARRELVVPLGERSYTVSIGQREDARVVDRLASLGPSALYVITDANVKRCRGARLELLLSKLAVDRFEVVLPAGERHKNITSVSALWDAALGHGVDRELVIVAFGGGVVGDMAAFVASTLLRGVRLVQIPTTLLSMVDASVGGKTGFDHASGKNLVGTFYQPSGVTIDIEHLATLPERELLAGMAEVIKIATTSDASLFEALEHHASEGTLYEPTVVSELVRRSVQAKIRIVRDDEHEKGARALLNFGHTLGHALEAHGNFTKYLHGEAVALGMVAELSLAVDSGRTDASTAARVTALLERARLPHTAPFPELALSLRYLASDKKREGTKVKIPVVHAIGTSSVGSVELSSLSEGIRRRI